MKQLCNMQMVGCYAIHVIELKQSAITSRPLTVLHAHRMIEGIRFDVDSKDTEYGPLAVAYLIIEGDFVTECEEYLGNEYATSISFEISRKQAEELVKQVERYL